MVVDLENYKEAEEAINIRLLQLKTKTLMFEDIFTANNCNSISIYQKSINEITIYFNQDDIKYPQWLNIDLDKTAFGWNTGNCNAVELFIRPNLG
jgi:hypothetical protein